MPSLAQRLRDEGKKIGFKLGEKQGVKQGETQRAEAIARNMLLNGENIERVALFTGLPKERIEKLYPSTTH